VVGRSLADRPGQLAVGGPVLGWHEYRSHISLDREFVSAVAESAMGGDLLEPSPEGLVQYLERGA
jgi:hypothetical protein